jgi:predicted transcriptional regulator
MSDQRAPGRPQEFGDRITKAVRLEHDLNERLKAEARARNVSANLLINAAVKDYLGRLLPVEDALRTAR